jgi:rhamnogalacturonan endolyase
MQFTPPRPRFASVLRLAALLPFLCLALAGVLAAANDPGGGAAGVGANVTLTTTSTTATLNNGVINAVVDKATGRVTSYRLNGTQMVDPANPIYYSMDGGSSYEQPSGCVYSVVTQTADMVEISCKRTWNATAGYKHVFDIDLRWVLRRGDTGLYAYAILDHPAAYPAATVGEWRIVWKLPRSATTFTFERAYVDDLRNWEMPSYYDYQQSSPTSIAEIVKLNTGVRAGKYDGKYSYSARYFDIGTWGHASNIAKKGVWFVLGGHDYFNDGPTKQDLTSSESYILMHFGRNHYNASGIGVGAGESWRKMFGPFLLYCNGTTATTNAGDALWADAKAQVAAEKAAWPYSWLVNADHPAAAGRGTVTGRLVVNDALKPGVSGAGARVGLAAPEDVAGNWQFQSKGYQYWTVADASGNFTIPAVRPGSYTLYAFNDGVVGEYSKTGVTVTAGGTNAQGTLTWTVAHPGASIAWEIGTPDRTAKEFRHGNDYFEPFLWNGFAAELPNPLVYTVGVSNPATDWNYVHTLYATTDANGVTTTVPWNWKVNFNLPAVPATGNAVLTIAVASSHYSRLWLTLNDEPNSFARISPPVDGGNALLRQGIHAKYCRVDISIPVSRLKVGANTFTFGFSGSDQSTHVMYDYLRLELPAFPPPPPSSGRTVTWKGGATSAANAWDNGSTAAWTDSATSAATAFGTGDKVVFDATGSNSTGLNLAASVEPERITVSGTKSYALAGLGELRGQMSLVKSGSGTFTLTPASLALAGGVTTAGSPVVDVTSTAGALPGLLVAGTGIPDGTRIQTVDSATRITLSANATATGSALALTVGGRNTFAGTTTITGGAVAFGSDSANNNGLGTSDVSLRGGALTMYTRSNNPVSSTGAWNIDVPSGQTGTLNVGWRCTLTGKLTGGGILNYALPDGSVRADLKGDWSGFTGRINATAPAGKVADFRMALDYSWPGLPAAALNLGAGVTAHYPGILNSGLGTFVSLGELSGSGGLKGGNNAGRQITYRIGGLNTDATYAGTISEQANGLTHLAKVGAGTWTYSGAASINGSLDVQAGTLRLAGSLAGSASSVTEIEDSATLALAGGSHAAGTVHVGAGGALSGHGALTAAVVNDGTVAVGGGLLSVSGDLTHNAALSVAGGSRLSVAGAFAADAAATWRTGLLSDSAAPNTLGAVVAGAAALGPGATVELDFTSAGSSVSFASAFWTAARSWPVLSAGTVTGTLALGPVGADSLGRAASAYGAFSLLNTTTGATLIWTPLSTYERWQIQWFGSTGAPTAASAADPDGDGQPNATEQIAGTDPTDPRSRFVLSISSVSGALQLSWPAVPGQTYAVQACDDLAAGPWVALGNLTAPASTASFTPPATASPRRFFRVVTPAP